MTRVKFCGITNIEDARAAVACGADALGFVLATSRRHITAAQAGEIVRALPPFVTAVAVTVNEPIESLQRMLEASGCHAVQLSGKENPDYVREFDMWRTMGLGRWRAIKTFHVISGASLERLRRYPHADAFLLDSGVPGKAGGTGVTFDWKVAQAAKELCDPESGLPGLAGKPIILAGGLNPDNVGEALEAARPYAVDVSSGVEAHPGRKDRNLMREFVRVVREFDARQA